MSFSLNYLQRVAATVDLNKISNPLEGQVTGQGPSMWLFNGSSTAANNSAAQIATSAYFDGAVGYLSQGDLVYAQCNDSTNTVAHLYNVTSVTGVTPVTVAQLA